MFAVLDTNLCSGSYVRSPFIKQKYWLWVSSSNWVDAIHKVTSLQALRASILELEMSVHRNRITGKVCRRKDRQCRSNSSIDCLAHLYIDDPNLETPVWFFQASPQALLFLLSSLSKLLFERRRLCGLRLRLSASAKNFSCYTVSVNRHLEF